jgi:glycosyltransferase involved in cell wall biosynthesis
LPNAQNPKVSVIVPNYNHARFLRQRIDSILAQTFKDFELILLDDDSKDESLAILRGYA